MEVPFCSPKTDQFSTFNFSLLFSEIKNRIKNAKFSPKPDEVRPPYKVRESHNHPSHSCANRLAPRKTKRMARPPSRSTPSTRRISTKVAWLPSESLIHPLPP